MKKVIAFILAAVMLVGLVGCSGGVPQEEYDKAIAEKEALLKEKETLASENDELKAKNEELKKSLDDKKTENGSGGMELEDYIAEAALEVVAENFMGDSECKIAGTEYVQFMFETETDDASIKKAYEDAMSELRVIQGVLATPDDGGAGEVLSQFSAFFIKAVDENGITVFELSYHPNATSKGDIAIGSLYLQQVADVIG